jgi:hypothetical protein
MPNATPNAPATHAPDPLQALGLRAQNPGAWSGAGLEPACLRPADRFSQSGHGRALAQVRGASSQDYDEVMASAVAAADAWRRVPAPKRGETVRLVGEELRAHKDALGSLVSLENGKIKAEGDGEVQEMIDIADFAVGQSRMLYGLDHAFGAAGAPHVRAVASAGRGRGDFRLQFSGCGLVLERISGRDCRQCHRLEALAQNRTVRPRGAASASA